MPELAAPRARDRVRGSPAADRDDPSDAEPGRAGARAEAAGVPGVTTGRSSRSCSRVQIGQFWISRL
ncbi:MAG: hypothetical protein JOZ07_08080 [Solirubrobacterales bacterium]|nr:hypothetical protein [Solirubrobacterales bacterium]